MTTSDMAKLAADSTRKGLLALSGARTRTTTKSRRFHAASCPFVRPHSVVCSPYAAYLSLPPSFHPLQRTTQPSAVAAAAAAAVVVAEAAAVIARTAASAPETPSASRQPAAAVAAAAVAVWVEASVATDLAAALASATAVVSTALADSERRPL